MGDSDLSGLKVMVADDEPKLRALVASCARAIGSDVVEAKDGDEAWSLAQSQALDVVVLDVMMPGMSGWEVCRRIKSSARTARGLPPKVLMLTGIGEHLNEMTSPLFAADDWIDKPFDLEQLRNKIAELGAQSLAESAAAPSGPSLRKVHPDPSAAELEAIVPESRPIPDTPAAVAAVTAVVAEKAIRTVKKAARKAKKALSKKKAASPKKAAKKAAPKKKALKKKALKKKAAPKKAAKKKAAKKALPKKKALKKKAAPKKAAKKRAAKKAAPKKKVAKKAAPKKKVAKKAAPKKKAKRKK